MFLNVNASWIVFSLSPQMSSFSTRALTLLSSIFGACGLLLVGVAVSTDYWLLMEEGIVLQQNQTTEVKMALHSGLWRVCFVAGPEKGRCVASEYFTEPEIEITTENTANILKMVRTATPFPMVSLLFVFTAFVISNIGHIRPQRTILAFVSGIFFILSGLSLVVGLVLYISSINDEVMNRPREPEQFFHYRYGWSFAFAASSFLLKEGAGVMSVYLFMKRYAEEELYRPHPALYRPRMSECSDYSGQFLHPDSWPPPQRGRSASDVSSDISIQLNQTPPQAQPKGGSSSQPTPSSSGPSSAASYQLQAASSSSTSSSYPHPLHMAATSTLPRGSHGHGHPHPHPHPSGPPPQSLPMGVPPSAVPPPRYHTHMRMSASPC
ncbi:calcium channel, voltage-dependent, gamma subunit 7a isoform X1 [Centropristis striata]|uniref:calcium channel, voltage-dependent, gamma subunit 7a isoform X1 n=2 Tax=Centropristis striata TaxID=184440 RepID=UPI0027DFD9E9|nr:calcium channel, voltage-dependent, gamma subunit 7a isoform X1 [Centropristis striata]